jgi:FAD/FMN-containing dehydrogenase
MASDELHDYIHNVLETGDNGPHRHIIVDKATLNDAIDKYRPRIASFIKPDVVKTLSGDEVEPRVVVKNDLGNISFQCIVTEPANLDEVVQIIAKAKRKNMSVKAAGSLRAFSPICETNGYLIKSDKLTGVSRSPTATLKDPSQAEGLYDILSGTTLQAIIDALEKDGRALMNLGGSKAQGIVGATATGTHGSGLTLPPLASMICSVHLVSAKFDANGQPIQYRIEPTSGITDPKLHSNPAVLIQDDATFNAIVTGLGAFGVVYSVTITTVPFYWVKETRQMVDWPTARRLLEQGPEGDILKHHNAEVWINPYTFETLITRRDLVQKPTGPLAAPKQNLFATLVQQLPALRLVMETIKDDKVDDDLSSEVGATLAAFLKNFPLLVPTVLNIALSTQNHSEPKTAKYYDIYDIGFATSFPAISTEISFPLTTNLRATDAAIALVRKFHQQDVRKALAGLLSLRFTASTPVSVSMSFSADNRSPGRCYLEIFSLFNFFKSIQGFDDLSEPLSDQSVNNFQGRLHWGQYITPSFTTLQYKPDDSEFFSSISAFRSVAERFDPGHLMANEFLNKLIWMQP